MNKQPIYRKPKNVNKYQEKKMFKITNIRAIAMDCFIHIHQTGKDFKNKIQEKYL